METKTCRRCEQSKPLNAFHVKQNAAQGRYPYCKLCRREISGVQPKAPPALLHTKKDIEDLRVIFDKNTPPAATSPLRARLKARNAQRHENKDRSSEYIELIAVIRARADKYHTVRFWNAVREVEADPYGEHSEETVNTLFEAWDRIVRQDPDLASELDARLPIITASKERAWKQRRDFRNLEVIEDQSYQTNQFFQSGSDNG